MIVTQYVTQLAGRGECVYLMPIGDIHLGTKNCNENKLFETVKWIKDRDNVYWIGMGDMCEYINYTDKRFDSTNLHPRFKEHLHNLHYKQTELVGEILRPIKDKCMGLLEGNHEYKIKNKYHTSVADILAGILETRNLGYTCMIRWTLQRRVGNRWMGRNVIIYATHGSGGGAKTGAKINRIIDKATSFQADIYLMGHVHDKTFKDFDRLCITEQGEPRLYTQKQIFALTGTFFNTYQPDTTSYGEIAGYQPTPTGTVRVRIEPFRSEKIDGKSVDLPPHIHISG